MKNSQHNGNQQTERYGWVEEEMSGIKQLMSWQLRICVGERKQKVGVLDEGEDHLRDRVHFEVRERHMGLSLNT